MLTLEPRFKTCASSIAARPGSTMRQRIISAIASLSFIGAFRGFSFQELMGMIQMCHRACAETRGSVKQPLCIACCKPETSSGLRDSLESTQLAPAR